MDRFYRGGALTGVSAFALCLAMGAPAQAQSFTVPNGQTVGQKVMTGAGDTGHIQQGGETETVVAMETAVEMDADDQSLLNEGTVSTSSNLSLGIFSIGDNVAITNDGTIETTGAVSLGVRSLGANAKITNSGDISTTGTDATGLESGGGRAVILNSGTISTTGNTAYGILSAGFDAVIENSGTISTTGVGAHSISSTADDAAITNSGTISTTGFSSFGIFSDGDNTEIENSGTILTHGIAAFGIASAGDDTVIENSGTVSTTTEGAFAIFSGGANTTIENSGTLSTTADDAVALVSDNTGVVIRNSGTISTQGTNANAISALNLDAVIVNSGTISTTGTGALGILSTDADAAITNSGAISTTADQAKGIQANGDRAVVSNSGTISTSGQIADGISGSGADLVVTNSGAISVAGQNAYGIGATGDNAVVSNSGTITATGGFSYGIYSTGTDAVITNSGTITSEQSQSIVMDGQNPTLNLLRGTVLKGEVQFADPGMSTLNIGPGLSIALRLSGTPATINAFGMPLVVTGGTVYTADVTALGSESKALGDLTSGIFSAIGGRRRGDGAAVPLSYAPDKAPQTAVFRTDDVPTREAWLKGFGGMRDDDGSSTSAPYDQALAGIVSGIDVFASATGVAGIFLGGSWAKTEVELSQDVEAQSGFGGLYGTFGLGTATLDVALAAGFSSYDSERRVNNSLVGLETAEAEYDGWFVSPHLALTQPFVVGGHIVEAKVSAHYAGLFLDGYEETGSIANLSLDERDVHVFVGRAGLSVPVNVAHAGGGVTTVTPSLGVEGRAQFGDSTATGTFIGTDIVVDLDDGGTIGGFAGLKIEHETAAGLTFFAATEGLIEDDATRVFAKGGVRARF